MLFKGVKDRKQDVTNGWRRDKNGRQKGVIFKAYRTGKRNSKVVRHGNVRKRDPPIAFVTGRLNALKFAFRACLWRRLKLYNCYSLNASFNDEETFPLV